MLSRFHIVRPQTVVRAAAPRHPEGDERYQHQRRAQSVCGKGESSIRITPNETPISIPIPNHLPPSCFRCTQVNPRASDPRPHVPLHHLDARSVFRPRGGILGLNEYDGEREDVGTYLRYLVHGVESILDTTGPL
ncbi:hypothetical protein PMIN01_09812 [Paraphaeosphaeria minitans]|uniref:Uncharacterized protein n=1 Tax=Paraphaeosphaeria minitans TaxID=565426 RepID=A0A9P6GAS9_9PLEO|nr:hypothetical protein PMIN01_09812 [Paraphaeosphaeria minitans]